MADPERLELPTPAFEAQCSIQLSYGSDLANYPMLTSARTSIPAIRFCSGSGIPAPAQFLYRISPKLLYLGQCAFYCAPGRATMDSESTT